MEERTLGNDKAVRRSPVDGRKPWHRPELSVSVIGDVTRYALQNNHDASQAQS